jgi:hypothetical protein
MPLNIDMDFEEYMEKAKSLMGEWSYDKWSIQQGPESKIVIYSRRDHE